MQIKKSRYYKIKHRIRNWDDFFNFEKDDLDDNTALFIKKCQLEYSVRMSKKVDVVLRITRSDEH